MKPFNTKERFSIPNLMGYFRLLLIPVFCYLYLAKEAYHWAAGVVLLSSLTDLFDGMIARKFNMITNLGKALDPIAESGMYEKYHELSAGKTTVFISHRLASTRFCDRILLLEEGRITEEGTHGELLKRNGKYAQMYRVQSKYYEQAEAGLEGEVVL